MEFSLQKLYMSASLFTTGIGLILWWLKGRLFCSLVSFIWIMFLYCFLLFVLFLSYVSFTGSWMLATRHTLMENLCSSLLHWPSKNFFFFFYIVAPQDKFSGSTLGFQSQSCPKLVALIDADQMCGIWVGSFCFFVLWLFMVDWWINPWILNSCWALSDLKILSLFFAPKMSCWVVTRLIVGPSCAYVC